MPLPRIHALDRMPIRAKLYAGRGTERNPARWAGVAVASPAIWPAWGDAWVGDAFDNELDFRRNDVFADQPRLDRTPVWVGCGTSDPFYDTARRFAEALPEPRTRWADGATTPACGG